MIDATPPNYFITPEVSFVYSPYQIFAYLAFKKLHLCHVDGIAEAEVSSGLEVSKAPPSPNFSVVLAFPALWRWLN